jgi:hypothetical protein
VMSGTDRKTNAGITPESNRATPTGLQIVSANGSRK